MENDKIGLRRRSGNDGGGGDSGVLVLLQLGYSMYVIKLATKH